MGRKKFTWYEGMTRNPEGSSPDLKNRSWELKADVEIPEGGADGLLFTQGGRFNGIGLYVHEGKPVFLYNFLGLDRTRIAGPSRLTAGKHNINVKFDYTGGGPGKPADVTLLVDGKQMGRERIEKTIPIRISLDETLDIGEDTGTPVSEDYKVPFKFTGEIEKVTVELK